MIFYEVISGKIASNVKYQVVSGTSITYNSVVYNNGNFFTGSTGVTGYTKTSGLEIVTPASYYLGESVGIENDFYLGLYNDSSMFRGFSLELDKISYRSQIIKKT